ncbi:hypothetical protein [Halocynthiibacter sp.]|uniref:hypothetical protein n=1 Tax=Halocynthiibacter sp. TaxID=1979210 RepID=UPI003C386C4D
MAEAFVKLSDSYSTELLTQTYTLNSEWETASKNKYQGKAVELMQKARRAKVKLDFKRSVKAVWDAFRDAKIAEQEFLYLHDLFAPDILPEDYLSHVLKHLHANDDLPHPRCVIDGLEIYERLHKEPKPHYEFGYQWIGPREVSSRAYDRVEMLRRR